MFAFFETKACSWGLIFGPKGNVLAWLVSESNIQLVLVSECDPFSSRSSSDTLCCYIWGIVPWHIQNNMVIILISVYMSIGHEPGEPSLETDTNSCFVNYQ